MEHDSNMELPPLGERDFEKEMIFRASRSSGAGGQNVNKVNTKVELRFDVQGSALLTEDEKELLRTRAAGRISNDGFLIITSQSERSQPGNRTQCMLKFYRLLFQALEPELVRIPTKPGPKSVQNRLSDKKKISEKKSRRGPVKPQE
ncbi:MAG: alternative ribosome rescue aminoacyl-tRNA hydrolase ArfB [Bacteroidota bacterium]